MTMALPNVVQIARRQLADVTGLQVGSTVSVRKDESGWRVRVEALEKKSLPDSQDILATYELELDETGGLLNLTRVGMRRRMDLASSAAQESGA